MIRRCTTLKNYRRDEPPVPPRNLPQADDVSTVPSITTSWRIEAQKRIICVDRSSAVTAEALRARAFSIGLTGITLISL